MVARARSLPARLTPNGWLDALRQILVFATAIYAYSVVRSLADDPGMTAAAFQHARAIIDLERALHLFVEPAIQSWASGSHAVTGVSSWIYLNAQTTVMVAALVWLYMFRNGSYYFVRNMLVMAMGIALVGYVLFPTAPPRFFAEWGFTDTVANFTGVPPIKSAAVNGLFNPYAAVPSMHVAIAVMLGWPLSRLVRRRAAKVLWVAYPAVMTFVVVVTANHFLIDAALGGVTAALSAVGAAWLSRARPAVWSFAQPQGVAQPQRVPA